jgi:hypothetical protein
MLGIKNTNLTLLVPDESIAAKTKHELRSDVEGLQGSGESKSYFVISDWD